MAEAHDFYTRFFKPVRQVLDDGAVASLEARSLPLWLYSGPRINLPKKI